MATEKEEAQFLLQQGADKDKLGKDRVGNEGWGSPLINAAGAGDKEVVDVLLESGADANLGDEKRGGTPLMAGSERGRAEVVRFLLRDALADPTLQSCPRDDVPDRERLAASS